MFMSWGPFSIVFVSFSQDALFELENPATLQMSFQKALAANTLGEQAV